MTKTQLRHLIVTGAGFIGRNLRKHFEAAGSPAIQVWTAGRAGSSNSMTAIVEQNELENFGVVLSGWGGVTSSMANNLEVQRKSLKDFENQLIEVSAVRPQITLGLGSQIEKAQLVPEGLQDMTHYARAKIAAREQFHATMTRSGLAGKWLYVYSVYGLDMDPSWLLPQLIKAAEQKIPLRLGSCEQKWGLLHISDFCLAIELILRENASLPAEIDVGAEADKTLKELVLEVESLLGEKCATFSPDGPRSPDSIPDLTPLLSAGWEQRVNLRRGILEMKGPYG